MRRLLLSLCGALAVIAAVSVYAATRPDPNTQAAADRCARDTSAIFQRLVPNWAYVNDQDYPASGPSPPPQWASGVVDSPFERDLASHPAGIDDPFTHGSYDFNLNLRPDPASDFLVGTGNLGGHSEETGRLHSERETGSFPTWAWPELGDKVTMLGSWAWDCDHYQGEGEHTEFHPYRAIWVERTPSPRSATGEFEGDLYASTDGTTAGLQAECAHRTKGDRQAFRRCVAPGTAWLDPSGDYRVTLPVPPRPTPSARLRIRVLDAGSVGAPPVRATRSGRTVVVTLSVRAKEAQRLVVAKRVLVGWTPMPGLERPVHLRVSLVSLLVRRILDPTSLRAGQNSRPPGEWNVYVDANGIWSLVRPEVLRPRHNGQTLRLRGNLDLFVRRGAPWRFFVYTRECDFGALGSAFGTGVALFPCPLAPELGGVTNGQAGDDVPGYLAVHFRSAGSSLGLHRANSRLAGSTCPRSVRQGCYALTFRVSLVR